MELDVTLLGGGRQEGKGFGLGTVGKSCLGEKNASRFGS